VDSVRTRDTVEGALLAALAALLGLLAFYTGFGLVLPLPVLLAYRRLGGRSAVLVALVASGVLALWVGPLAAVGNLGFIAAQGLVPGWTLRRGWGFAGTVAVMAAALVAVGVLGLLGTDVLFHTNAWAQGMLQLAGFLRRHAALLRSAGLTPDGMLALARRLIPVAAAGGALAESVVVYLFAAPILGRLGTSLPPPAPFREWRMPAWTAWATLLCLVALAVGTHLRSGVLVALAVNLLLLAGVGYAITALSFVYGWLRSRGLPRGRSAVLLAGGAWLLGALGFILLLPLAGLVVCQMARAPGSNRAKGGQAS
jgi:uncharacterized protein YybS (DUF2232 family)